MDAILKIQTISQRLNLTTDLEILSQITPEKMVLTLMTSPITLQRDVKVGLLYSCLNENDTFSAIQAAVFNYQSLNLNHSCPVLQHIAF